MWYLYATHERQYCDLTAKNRCVEVSGFRGELEGSLTSFFECLISYCRSAHLFWWYLEPWMTTWICFRDLLLGRASLLSWTLWKVFAKKWILVTYTLIIKIFNYHWVLFSFIERIFFAVINDETSVAMVPENLMISKRPLAIHCHR